MPSQLGADRFVHEVYSNLYQLTNCGLPAFQSHLSSLLSWLPVQNGAKPYPSSPALSSPADSSTDLRPNCFYYVDVGAADGVALSNTEALERLGWQGVAVDPLLRGFGNILNETKSDGQRNSSNNTNTDNNNTSSLQTVRQCVAVRAAVYSTAGTKLQFVLAQDPNLSGFSNHLQAYRDLIASQQHQVYEVETKLLQDILVEVQAPTVLHYLSLDTEGSEFEILKSFPWDKRRLGVLTVEHNFEEPKRSLIRELMKEKGMVLAKEVSWDDW
eukprot:CAMPEP_0175043188 /NCGR_PEP_ID=MMETSP0052_2-20121109/3022_1 /TAXON_ID=51329 ORGANISM="Polytomella parva, Strain SAG 63-3" /NCGR_SAMPLE_ID=MMETSP0052_2 /ASSEMBLY_ACC=CAM_ASM_000194 /LENGTH=270 /DNA_ID=CAMNT_0016306167 /DNA_START=114 /DNA_END=923 /DNA_ORIENTATION=-